MKPKAARCKAWAAGLVALAAVLAILAGRFVPHSHDQGRSFHSHDAGATYHAH